MVVVGISVVVGIIVVVVGNPVMIIDKVEEIPSLPNISIAFTYTRTEGTENGPKKQETEGRLAY